MTDGEVLLLSGLLFVAIYVLNILFDRLFMPSEVDEK